MNFAAFERAQVAAFAYREARHTGSLDCMRAVCFIVRNRVKSSWGDGGWLSIIAQSHLASAYCEPLSGAPDMARSGDAGALTNSAGAGMLSGFRSDDRLLQLIVRDVDDIYLGQEQYDDRVRQALCGEPKKPVLYYSFVDREPRPWFKENIVRMPLEHPQVGQLGTMMLFR